MNNNSLFLIGNWKMNLDQPGTETLAEALKEEFSRLTDSLQLILAPSSIYLEAVKKLLEGSPIKIAAQNTFWEDKGTFTGEISPLQIKQLGIDYAICGHSERKIYVRETDEMIGKKLQAILKQNMYPIVCVGESFEERRQGKKNVVLANQLKKYFKNVRLSDKDFIIMAYEPVWAIGSGQACEPAEAEEASYIIKQYLMEMFPTELVNKNFVFIYGGSVNENNVTSFIDKDMIRGVLIGGASINLELFSQIIKLVLKISK